MKTKIARLAWQELQNLNNYLNNEIKTQTYCDFFQKLHANCLQDGTGPEAWRNIENMKAQTVVLVLDHDMSADCALAMLAAVHWATDISHLIHVRVLTVSFSLAPIAFRRLLDLYAHDEGFLFEVNESADILKARLGRAERVGSTYFNNNLLRSLADPLTSRVDKQIIICPSSSDYDQEPLRLHFSSERRTINEALEDRLAILETLPVGERIESKPQEREVKLDHIVADDNASVILRYSPGYRPPLPFYGFLQVHMHLASHLEQTIFDSFTLQVAQIRLAVSKKGRLEQLSLAFRTPRIPGRVRLYFEEQNLDDFLNNGPPEKLKVCNQHAGGFITALVCLLNWGIQFDRVVSCFFASDLERARFVNTSLILTLLPIVDFDYRLAAFIALHTNSTIVLKAKLQLAAILITGIDQLFTFPSHDETAKAHFSQYLVQACRGWTTALAHHGSMWMAVGLWKHSTLSDVRVNNESNLRGVKIPGTETTVNFPASLHVQKTLTSLTNALITHYIAVLPDHLPESPMSKEYCETIQEHLAYAYCNQTTIVTIGAHGLLQHQLKLGPADATFVSVPPRLIDSTHFDRLFREDNDLPHDSPVWYDSKICGIYHGLRREFGLREIHLDDWTYIPSKFIPGLECATFQSSLNTEELEV
ncbi:Ff.00g107360.m01.CDS01 [Fusarium sp. VM40]|nr:Ff.00g107360.m01.CDS01 [Fusarium sp. VM40]